MITEERIEIKGKALVKEFWIDNGEGVMDYSTAIRCTLICVKKQIELLADIDTSSGDDDIQEDIYQMELELEQMKKAIEKL